MRYLAAFLITICLPVSAQNFTFTQSDFEGGQLATLRGTWAFFWDTLFIPGQQTPVKSRAEIPHFWTDEDPGVFGRATYYAHVKLPEGVSQLSIYIPFLRCAGRIYIDGKLAGSSGIIDPPAAYHSKLGSLLINLPNKQEVDVVVQVANYENRWAGLSATPRIAVTAELLNRIQVKQGFDIFFAGSLVAMAIYLVTMFYLYRQGYSFLYLALICLAVVSRSLTTESSSLFLPNLFPDTGWSLWKKIEFISVYSIVALFPLYVSRVFPQESYRKIDLIFTVVATILCLTVLFSKHYVYVYLLDVAHIGLLLGFVYSCIVSAKALKKKNPDAKILFLGLLVAFPFILLEILKNSAILQVSIPFSHLVEFGVLIFLLFQVYVLANHYALTYQELETQVKFRTAELSKSNEINSRMLAILSHDVRGPVNTLKGIMHHFNQGQITEVELKPLTKQIESQASSISLLVENVLFWVKSQITGIEINLETFLLNEWINGHIDLYQIQANEKNLSLNSTIPDYKVKADKQIVSLVIRNLLSNAIKFSTEHTTITIHAHEVGSTIILAVENHGVGMTSIQVQSIFQNLSSTSSKDGTGIGLKLCRSYLLAMGSDFEIISLPNKKTTFSIALQKA